MKNKTGTMCIKSLLAGAKSTKKIIYHRTLKTLDTEISFFLYQNLNYTGMPV